jgi:predicted enzyme related to lactoylglutathione lyase
MSSSCLTDADVLALADGVLEPLRKAAADDHLDACGDCRRLVAEVARAPGRVERTTIGRYVLQEVVGAGGMGLVYRAWDPQLERSVALKILRGGRLGERGESELIAEARSLARLNDPNVVAVYDAGADDGLLFLVMELIEGHSLRTVLGERPRRGWNELERIFADAARGLAAAHDAGLVHRDVKPENVLIGRDGRVRVTDFGLALDEPGGAAASAGLAGTPLYLAPERLEGRPATARADQWAFCLMMAEALLDEPLSATGGLRLHEELGSGARLSRANVRPPRRVLSALRRGLDPRPDQRFPSMRALLAELEPPRPRRALWAAMAALVIPALVVIGATRHGPSEPAGKPLGRASRDAQHPVGTFRWVEMATNDAARAKRFYTELFGWIARDASHAKVGTYTTFFNPTGAVAGLYQITPEQKAAGRRPHWLPYVFVRDVDDATERARVLGADIVREPVDSGLGGRLAVVRDPGGAAVALLSDGPQRGVSAARGSPGSWVWSEREATQASASAGFYESWLGWRSDAIAAGTRVFRSGGIPVASIVDGAGPVGSPWIAHFAVTDCDAIVSRALTLGAELVRAPAPAADFGCRALLRDPEGLAFAVVRRAP